MAQSKYEYVKKFEHEDLCLLNCWIVVRIDGCNFHKFADVHKFTKPNDKRGLDLMNRCAESVMNEFKEVIIAYGESDEYSFVFSRCTNFYRRRRSKISTTVCSVFSSAYVFHWAEYFPDDKLVYPPSFDGRVVVYPTNRNLRDYLSWRQADCHINNLYNTTFWALVQLGGASKSDAEKRIRHTVSSEKNEILFSEFGINYNKELEQFKKGTVILREVINKTNAVLDEHSVKTDTCLLVTHCDIIGDKFWNENAHILQSD